MKILLMSRSFLPALGGIETASEALADAFQGAGHQVRLVTRTPGGEIHETFGYEVIRRPSPFQLLASVRWADVVLHNNINLRVLWPLLLVPRPWVVAHQTWLAPAGRSGDLAARTKAFVLRFATSVAISAAIAEALPVRAEIVPNPYRDDLFRLTNQGARRYDLAFLGRLVSDKGVDLLIDALGALKTRGLAPSLLIIGTGPEEAALRRSVARLGLEAQVSFAGPKRDAALVEALNQARILVVPSRWAEPFGIVALEGIACGCVVLGASGGGLADAIGACGTLFERGSADALADKLDGMLRAPAGLDRWRSEGPAHLVRHTRAAIGARYLAILARARRGDSRVPAGGPTRLGNEDP
jgi:glycogen synthase